MKIEDVEAIKYGLDCVAGGHGPFRDTAYALIEALRAEAWHPIEKAEELGAKDGRWLLVWAIGEFWDVRWTGQCWVSSDNEESVFDYNPTHFRFINPPEGS